MTVRRIRLRGARRPRSGIPRQRPTMRIAAKPPGGIARASGSETEALTEATNSTRDAKRDEFRGRSRAEPSRTRRIGQDCDSSLTSRLASGRKDAQFDRPRRRARLPRNSSHVDKAQGEGKSKGEKVGPQQNCHGPSFYLLLTSLTE